MNETILSVVCQGPCLWLGDHLDFCRRPVILENPSFSPLWTWRPENAEWIYLIKVMGFTLAYVPSSDTVYFVNPAFSLKNSCPANTVIVCQCTRDPNSAPRLLAVDLLCVGGKSTSDLEPPERYAKLQGLAQHFVEPNCSVQWCGDRNALTEDFLKTLPHKTIARVGIGITPGDFILEDV